MVVVPWAIDAKQRDQRQLVDEPRDLAPPIVVATSSPWPTSTSPIASPAIERRLRMRRGRHPLEHVEEPGATRVEAEVVDGDARAGKKCRRDEEGRGRGDVAGYEHLGRRGRRPARRWRIRGGVTRAPAAASISSVWSMAPARERWCARRRARRARIADFTCALATEACSRSPPAPALDHTGNPPPVVSIAAPMSRAARRSGPSVGGERLVAVDQRPSWKARIPEISRARVPALPQSSGPSEA